MFPEKTDGGMREELDRFKREVNLSEFAASRGYRIDRRESSRGTVVMRHPGTDDKIIIARRQPQMHWIYFSVRDSQDNGTIIDFVQRRDRLTFGQARKELRDWTEGLHPAASTDGYASELATSKRDREAVARLFGASHATENSTYLNSRGIRPETLSAPRFRDTFRVDGRGNVLFPHRDDHGLCGFESKNHRWTSFSSGGRKTIWTSRQVATDTRLVLAESAIDAISYHQLHSSPATRYASTGGAFGKEALEIVLRAMAALPPGGLVVTAFDADVAGDKIAGAIDRVAGGVAVERHRPPLKDWNDVLKQKERAYIASLARHRGLDRGGM